MRLKILLMLCTGLCSAFGMWSTLIIMEVSWLPFSTELSPQLPVRDMVAL